MSYMTHWDHCEKKEKKSPSRTSSSRADDSSEGLLWYAWHKVRGNDYKSARKQDGLSAKEPKGKDRNSSYIWKGNELARHPGENTESIACFYGTFLSPSLSREKACLPFHYSSLCHPSPPQSPPPEPAEMCYSVWKAESHHSAPEYWMGSSNFD